ncbi:MAG: ribose 5-phosphate isomerase B [candidate division KSB1 bacterium]|nr:ribose 5-phosphate isomerase B [candidate division KSB1 bacterium]
MDILALGSDHAGFALKEKVKAFLETLGLKYQDFGTYSEESTDYSDYGAQVAKAVSEGTYRRAILICASGIGMSIVANKFKGVRAALCTSEVMAEYSRKHNDANILVLGGRITDENLAKKIIKIWLDTPFEGGRHARRVNKIHQLSGL